MGIEISIAMCTFNGGRFLAAQLASIAAQQRIPDELVICDDGSSDQTLELVENFTRQAAFPVRFSVNETRLGATKNFERAISACRGHVITLADQDDIWLPQKLAVIEAAFVSFPGAAGIFSNAELIDESSRGLPDTLWDHFFRPFQQRGFDAGEAFNLLMRSPIVTGATMAFRREYCGLILPIPADHIHDYWISLLLSACGCLRPIDESLIRYRIHPSQHIGFGVPLDSLRARMAVSLKTGAAAYRADAERYKQWRQRLIDCRNRFPVAVDAVRKLAEKIEHYEMRASLSPSLWQRWAAVYREARRRRYWKYSCGWKSVGKDLLLLPRQ